MGDVQERQVSEARVARGPAEARAGVPPPHPPSPCLRPVLRPVTVRPRGTKGGGGVSPDDLLMGLRQGCIQKAGRSPLQGARPKPGHCPPDAKRQLQWHL